MSEVFHISLESLIKSDLEKINSQEYADFQKNNTIFSIVCIAWLILPVPLAMLWKWFGMAVYLCLVVIGMYFAL